MQIERLYFIRDRARITWLDDPLVSRVFLTKLTPGSTVLSNCRRPAKMRITFGERHGNSHAELFRQPEKEEAGVLDRRLDTFSYGLILRFPAGRASGQC